MRGGRDGCTRGLTDTDPKEGTETKCAVRGKRRLLVRLTDTDPKEGTETQQQNHRVEFIHDVSLTPTRKRVLKHLRGQVDSQDEIGLTDTDPKEGTETYEPDGFQEQCLRLTDTDPKEGTETLSGAVSQGVHSCLTDTDPKEGT